MCIFEEENKEMKELYKTVLESKTQEVDVFRNCIENMVDQIGEKSEEIDRAKEESAKRIEDAINEKQEVKRKLKEMKGLLKNTLRENDKCKTILGDKREDLIKR